MKPTDFSHNPARFRFSDPTRNSDQAIGWSFMENLENVKPQLGAADSFICQVHHGSKKTTSFGLCRPDTDETEYHEVFEDLNKEGSVDLWASWKNSGHSHRLLRSRSLIRTNPWLISPGESPPWSPSDPDLCRCWSAVETEMSSLGSLSPQDQVTPTAVENETPSTMSNRFYRREDSLLTTSVESDSLYQSMTSDTDTATSLMSASDVTLSDVFKDERSRDVTSGDASKAIEAERSISSSESRYIAAHQDRELTGKKFDHAEFETVENRSKDIRTCVRSGSSGFSFNLQLKRPSFGGKRFSEIADEYEAKTAKWLRSGKTGMTAHQSTLRSKDSLEIQGEDFTGQLNPRPSTNLQQEIETRREGLDIPIHDAPFSSSLQFCKKIMAIRSSLQEKVAQLRREKRTVDEKIREAKEEERIRLLQLEKFRRQLSNTRKEILLRTIEEMKRSLNEQSLKLQKLYDFVLLEQRQMLRCQ